METGPRFIVPSDGLEKPGVEPAIDLGQITSFLPLDPLTVMIVDPVFQIAEHVHCRHQLKSLTS